MAKDGFSPFNRRAARIAGMWHVMRRTHTQSSPCFSQECWSARMKLDLLEHRFPSYNNWRYFWCKRNATSLGSNDLMVHGRQRLISLLCYCRICQIVVGRTAVHCCGLGMSDGGSSETIRIHRLTCLLAAFLPRESYSLIG